MRTSGMGCGGGGWGCGPFYRAEEAGEAADQRGNDRRAVEFYSIGFRRRNKGREGVVLVGEMKKAGHRFSSATRTWRRVADGGADPGGDSSSETEEEEGPVGPVMGRKVKTSWASAKFFQGEWSGLQI
jgi:hypothetical protein